MSIGLLPPNLTEHAQTAKSGRHAPAKSWQLENKVSSPIELTTFTTVIYAKAVEGSVSQGVPAAPSKTKIPTAKTPASMPLETLLDCEPDVIAVAGRRAAQWLERQADYPRTLFLSWLTRAIQASVQKTSPISLNVVAAVELLARYDTSTLASIVTTELQKRPVGENDLYLIALCSDVVSAGSTQAASVAEAVERVLDDQFQAGVDSSVDWQNRLVVEAFRVLTKLDVNRATGPICRWIPSLGEMEMTAVLDEVTKAARQTPVTGSAELRSAINDLWARYNSNPNLANAPGVMAKLIELRGSCGYGITQLVELAKSCPSPAEVLYLLAMRRPPSIGREGRRAIYAEAFKQLTAKNHRMALKHVIEAMTGDSELQPNELASIVSQTA